jgi:bisphosphoglycerate-dependent phosphoglycerate mutase
VCGHSNTNRAFVKMMENISDQDIPKREIAYDEPLFYAV